MRKTVYYIATVAIFIAVGFLIGPRLLSSSEPERNDESWMHAPDPTTSSATTNPPVAPREYAEFTDGVVTAVFNKEAGTLTFSGNGAVGETRRWLETFEREERIFVRTIVFEEGITGIGSLEFDSDSGRYINLEKVIFQGDINTVDYAAFSENRNLTTVEFHGGCRTIEDHAFYECSALESINVPDGCIVNKYAFRRTAFDDTFTTTDSAPTTPTPPATPKSPIVEQTGDETGVAPDIICYQP